jgi:Ala-tRNA(Pro) deacylase
MPIQKLTEYLDSHDIKYVVISHSVAYTAQETAAFAHVSGKAVAKTVIMKIDGELAMAVLPASVNVDPSQLRTAAGAKSAELASEEEFQDRFPDCETGAMPPFGNLYGMPVFADESLTRDKEIAFNAGSHRELVRLSWEDFERLVKPKVTVFAFGKMRSSAA